MLKKFILCVFLSNGLFAVAHAHVIHKLTISIDGNCCPDINLSTQVGDKNDDGVCEYTYETAQMAYPFCGPSRTYSLKALKLKEKTDKFYTCAATHIILGFHPDNTSEKWSYFTLINDGQNYTDTDPHNASVHLDYQCSP